MKYLILLLFTLPQAFVGGLFVGTISDSVILGLIVGVGIFGFGLDVLLNGRKDDDDYPCK